VGSSLDRLGQGELARPQQASRCSPLTFPPALCSQTRARILGTRAHLYLACLWVLPAYQGRGIGSALVQAGVDFADQQTPRLPIYLEASAAGAPLYKAKFQFEVEGDSEYQELVRWAGTK
jgi:GNAT superfamily N-acetyltransferase